MRVHRIAFYAYGIISDYTFFAAVQSRPAPLLRRRYRSDMVFSDYIYRSSNTSSLYRLVNVHFECPMATQATRLNVQFRHGWTCQGIPETLLHSHHDSFFIRKNEAGFRGTLTRFLPLYGQRRCLRLHGTLKKRTNLSARKEPQMSAKNPRKRPCKIDLHITIDERNDIRSKSDIGGLDL